MELAPFTVACLAIGLASGFLGGLLGIGGGIVIVPALILLFDISRFLPLAESTAVAVATSLGCILFTSLSAAIAQVRAGRVEWRIVRRWLGPVVLGAAFAGWFAPQLPGGVLRLFIGSFLGAVSIVLLTRWQPPPGRRFPGPVPAAGLGLGAGFSAGMAGIGGGNVMVPTMIYFNIPVHRATATSSSLGVPLAAAGALGYMALATPLPSAPSGLVGYVHLPTCLALIVGAVLAAPLGVRLAARLQPDRLRQLFGALLTLASLRMLWTALA